MNLEASDSKIMVVENYVQHTCQLVFSPLQYVNRLNTVKVCVLPGLANDLALRQFNSSA